MTKNTVEHVKKQMMTILLELIMQRPEEERTLLALIVNKYGDNEKKVSKYVSTLLKRLLSVHPNMTCIVLQQLGQFVSRAGIPPMSILFIVKFINKLKLIPPTIVWLIISYS